MVLLCGSEPLGNSIGAVRDGELTPSVAQRGEGVRSECGHLRSSFWCSCSGYPLVMQNSTPLHVCPLTGNRKRLFTDMLQAIAMPSQVEALNEGAQKQAQEAVTDNTIA